MNAPGTWREDKQALAEKQCFFDRVGDQDDGFASFFPELEDKSLHLFARQSVEGAQGFIHKDHIGIICETTGEGDTLLHPARKFEHGLFFKVAQANNI